MKHAAFEGLYVATLTPFDEVLRLNLGTVRKLTDHLAKAGVAGICPAGTTGEWLYLSVGEKARLIEESVRAAAGRMRVIAGIGALSPKEIGLLARAAESAGADAVFLTPPIYYPASEDVIFRYYAAVKERTTLPVLAYNIPAYAANSLSLACVQRLVEEQVISGIKDSSAGAERIEGLVRQFGSRISVLAASDSFATEARRLGAHGFVSALANICPEALLGIWQGDVSLQPRVDALRTAVKESGGIPALKALASRRGFPMGEARVPSVPLSAEQIDRLARLASDR